MYGWSFITWERSQLDTPDYIAGTYIDHNYPHATRGNIGKYFI